MPFTPEPADPVDDVPPLTCLDKAIRYRQDTIESFGREVRLLDAVRSKVANDVPISAFDPDELRAYLSALAVYGASK